MDEQALERARQRIAEARTEGVSGARLDAALERARAEVMRLAKVADDLEASLPKQVSTAVRDGVAREVLPVSRSLAEIRGGLNQALRRLERLEQELLAERNSRIEDLAILVDLVSSGWSGVDQRLRTLEAGIAGAVVPLRSEREDATLPTSAADAA
jgi:signal transduction histidine kinase